MTAEEIAKLVAEARTVCTEAIGSPDQELLSLCITLIHALEACAKDADRAERAERALRRLWNVLGPTAPACLGPCEGCEAEWKEALQTIEEYRRGARNAD